MQKPSKSSDQKRSRRGRSSYKQGLVAEWVACLFLLIKGYHILARRYKTSCGEVDLIARKGGTLCFIEVKSRLSRSLALESISKSQQQRILNTAHIFMQQYKSNFHQVRFDAIVVERWKFPYHLKHAWWSDVYTVL